MAEREGQEWQRQEGRQEGKEKRESEGRGESGRKRKIFLYRVALLVLIILLAIFFIRPGIIGYGVYQQVKESEYTVDELGASLRELQAETAAAQAALSTYQSLNSQLQQQTGALSENLSSALIENERLHSQLEREQQSHDQQLSLAEEKLTTLREERTHDIGELTTNYEATIASLEEEHVALDSEYQEFIRTIARSVCCKEKVDDPAISSYEVLNGRLVCLEEGQNELHCFT